MRRFWRRRSAPAPTADVADELTFHLERRIADLTARGMPADRAARQAQREFGDVDEAAQYMRRMDARIERARRRRNLMGDVREDIRLAWRRLRRSPAFAVTAILTLALGIGANAAIFSVVHGVLVRPLPFPSPERLYALFSTNRTANMLQASVSAVDVDDWRRQRQVIDDLGAYYYAEGSSGIDLTGRGAPRHLSALFFTPGFLSTLAIRPAEGRLPREDEMVRGGRDTVVLLTYGFWMAEFGGSPSVVGTALTLGGRPYEVIGVLPRELRFPTDRADVFIPYSTIPDSSIPRFRWLRILSAVARAKPGVSRDAVQAEMNAIAGRLAREVPENQSWDGAAVVPLDEIIAGPVRLPLLVLMGAVGFVLLIACVNLAGLQLARGIGQRRELGIRIALGARRARLVRQLLTESLVLAALGTVAGLAIAQLALTALMALGARELPRAGDVHLDLTVVAFVTAIGVVCGLLVGVLPALRATAAAPQQALRENGRTTASADTHRLRTGLVVVEIALAMILTVGAGLMTRSFVALLQQDPGFNPDRLLAVQFTIDPDRHGARPPAGTVALQPYALFYERVIERVRTLPGIEAAAAVKDPPFRGTGERNSFRVPGRPTPAGQDDPTASVIHVSYDYFKTIGARVDGREFTPRDRVGAPFVVVVNEAFARAHFPGQRAVGQRLAFGAIGRETSVEIVGVVNDIRQVAMHEPARPTMYFHNLLNTRVKTTIVVRTADDPLAVAARVREAIWSLDPLQPITAVFTFDDSVRQALSRPRLLTVLLAAFGVVGLVLGGVGIYGTLAYVLHERRREIGVRLALGARPADVRWMLLRRGAALAACGVGLGLAGAMLMTRWLAAVLYGVGPYDPLTLTAVATILVGAAMVASWVPARRAARLDPVQTLRGE